jgi:hypothetical protein
MMKRLLQSSLVPLVGPLIEPGAEASTGPSSEDRACMCSCFVAAHGGGGGWDSQREVDHGS